MVGIKKNEKIKGGSTKRESTTWSVPKRNIGD